MNHPNLHINEEHGFALIASLLVLTSIAILALSILTDTKTGLRIASNERVYRQNFARADAATSEFIQKIENYRRDNPVKLRERSENGQIKHVQSFIAAQTLEEQALLDNSEWAAESVPSDIFSNSNTRSLCIDMGVPSGHSLDLSAGDGSLLHTFRITGKSATSENKAAVAITVAYKMRY